LLPLLIDDENSARIPPKTRNPFAGIVYLKFY
jgi:hypothetical protein